jgi:hypothetical protein
MPVLRQKARQASPRGMSIQIAKNIDINGLIIKELDDAIAVLRPVDTQRGRHDVFGAQHAGFDAALSGVDFKIDRFGLSQGLRIAQ